MSSDATPMSSSCGGGGFSSLGGGRPCGACKFLRRKCMSGCVFAPYFDSEQGAAQFAAVHKVFGASNVAKLLLQIAPHRRPDAVLAICYEAQARLSDPVYGCVADIFALQQQVVNLQAQVVNLQAQVVYLQAQLATLELPLPVPLPAPSQMPMTAPFSIADHAQSSSFAPATVDLSFFFDSPTSSHWAALPQNLHPYPHQSPHQQLQNQPCSPAKSGGDGGDLQELARQLLAAVRREG